MYVDDENVQPCVYVAKLDYSFIPSTYLASVSPFSLTLLLLDGYTFYSVKQEKIMDELDEEAKMRGAKTGTN